MKCHIALDSIAVFLILTQAMPKQVKVPDCCGLVLCQAAFESLLAEPLLAVSERKRSTLMASASQLKYLVLKNLALLLAETDETAMRALQLYAQALLLDDGDPVVWNRMATLVRFEAEIACLPLIKASWTFHSCAIHARATTSMFMQALQ
jgi:hypothetical protein